MSSETGQPNRRRLGGRSARVREAVLDAAATLVQERGFGAVSVAAIAELAGVNATSIYRRWGTKENLGLAVALRGAQLSIPIPDTGSLRGDLLALAGAINAYQQTPLGQALLRSLVSTAATDNRQAFWETRQAATSAALQRAEARGELRGDFDHRLVLESIVGVLFMRNFLAGEGTDDDKLQEAIDLLIEGIGAGS